FCYIQARLPLALDLQGCAIPDFVVRPADDHVASLQVAEELNQVTLGGAFSYIHPLRAPILVPDYKRTLSRGDYTRSGNEQDSTSASHRPFDCRIHSRGERTIPVHHVQFDCHGSGGIV